jgi:CRP/FNR family cyclic AMP-dependent transcriptional regulator
MPIQRRGLLRHYAEVPAGRQEEGGTLKERFEGNGRAVLIEALQRQEFAGGDVALAAALADAGTLVEFRPGDTLIQEGATDDDMYFLVAGRAGILVKGRQIAVRGAGNHVGEMSAIEPAQVRSATVVAETPTVAVKLSSSGLMQLGTEYPQIWKPIARELSRRLFQRNDLISAPNDQPKLFIMSSVEALPVAREVASGLQYDVLATVWTDGVFFATGYPLEALEAAVDASDFAVAITQFEDIVERRGERRSTLRDNVVFELGLFMGKLGRRRTMLVQPRSRRVELPSDLNGLTTIGFPDGDGTDLPARLGPACNEIRKIVQQWGVRAR